jgi:hypothetical protein
MGGVWATFWVAEVGAFGTAGVWDGAVRDARERTARESGAKMRMWVLLKTISGRILCRWRSFDNPAAGVSPYCGDSETGTQLPDRTSLAVVCDADEPQGSIFSVIRFESTRIEFAEGGKSAKIAQRIHRL